MGVNVNVTESGLINTAHKSTSRRTACGRYAATALALAVGVGMGTGVAMGASGTWLGGTSSDWGTDTNWNPTGVPGNNSGLTTSTTDDATFSTTSNLQVNPDASRRIRDITFDSDAGNYIIGPASGANTLYLQRNITGQALNKKITFNSPIRTIGNSGIATATGQTFDFKGLYTLAHGQTLGIGGSGTINFDGGFSSSSTTADARANINFGSASVVNFNAASPVLQRVGISWNSTGTVNLNATHVIFGDTGNGGPGNRNINLSTGGGGILNVNATDAIHGSASVWAGNTTSGTTSVVTINHDQANTGRLSTGTYAGVSFGTLLGNVGYVGGNNINGPDIGADGNTTSTLATASPTLLVNNNASNAGASHTASGSATGNSDVNIVTGLLGGNGYIVNSDVTINSINYAQGVTLHKRTNTTNSTVTYGKLSPGASAGAVGTLTMDLGSKGLNIGAAVADNNTQSLLFDLIDPNNSDKVNLLNTTTLHIGSGGLGWNDFVFSTTGSIPAGTYTLFSSQTNAIDGTLDLANNSGVLDGQNFHLDIINGGKDLVLTTVPEPATLGLLTMGGLGLLARRRRA